MSDILSRIASFTPPARLAVYLNITAFFDRVGYTDHDLDVEQADADEAQATDILNSLEFRYHDHLGRYLNGLGVWLDVDHVLPLQVALSMAEGCADIVLDPPADGYQLTEEGDEPEVALATALGAFSDITTHEALQAVGFTDGKLLQHLLPPDERDMRSEEPDRAVARYRQYVTAIGLRSGSVYAFIQARNRLPLYLAGTAKAVGPNITDTDPAVWAHEWASMALASEVPDAELVDRALEEARRYSDPAVFVRFAALLEDVIKEHTHDTA